LNIQQALHHANEQLGTSSPSPLLDAQILLSFVLHCNSAHLIAWPDKTLNEEQLSRYLLLVKQRNRGHPVAHLTGTKEFWSLDFFVDDSTLIPRPETETLIEFTLDNFSENKRLKLLDMGTGSGAIAISIASERAEWEIIACDISEQALVLANKNSLFHQTKNISLINSDWFSNIKDNNFDIIISNPPYIETDDPHLSQGDVRFEPASALTAGETGMDDIEQLCSQAKGYLTKGGTLIIEHGYNQKQKVFDCFTKNSFEKIEQKQDLSGHVRMTTGKSKL